jgi:hypothetical protein
LRGTEVVDEIPLEHTFHVGEFMLLIWGEENNVQKFLFLSPLNSVEFFVVDGRKIFLLVDFIFKNINFYIVILT